MNSKAIRMKIRSTRYEIKEFLFAQFAADLGDISEEMLVPKELCESQGDEIEINTNGTLSFDEGRTELSYDETELTGMEGSTTALSFSDDIPELVTMVRNGTVSTALVFEPGKRHHCIYKTPYMPFDVCVHTLKVDNLLKEQNRIFIDYIIEIRGAKAERTKLEVTCFE